MTDAQQWNSVHIYYYDENKDDLILDCTQPLFQKACEHIGRFFFVRHWLHGPHLRLRFFCDEEQFDRVIKPLIEAQVGCYLQDHPSTTVLDEEKLRPVYERLAKQEQENESALPLYPNNSLQYLPYDRRLHVLKSPLMVELLEDFYVATNDLVFEMLSYIRQGHNLLTLSLDLMYTTAHTMSPHIANGFLSYRSHAEGFIIGCAQPQAMRALFDQKYQAQAEALMPHLRRLLEALDRQEDTFPFTLSWLTILKSFWTRVEPLVKDGQLDTMPHLEGDIPGFISKAREHLAQSAFHSTLESHQEYKKALYENKWFQSYRLMLNMLYLHLNRLGLRPIERFMLCHLAANSVEQVFHVNAVEMISGFDVTPYAAYHNQGREVS